MARKRIKKSRGFLVYSTENSRSENRKLLEEEIKRTKGVDLETYKEVVRQMSLKPYIVLPEKDILIPKEKVKEFLALGYKVEFK
jgi:hypothetical protein